MPQGRVAVTPFDASIAEAVFVPPSNYVQQVGLLGGQTSITMNPADMSVYPRTDISAFTIIAMDAGTF